MEVCLQLYKLNICCMCTASMTIEANIFWVFYLCWTALNRIELNAAKTKIKQISIPMRYTTKTGLKTSRSIFLASFKFLWYFKFIKSRYISIVENSQLEFQNFHTYRCGNRNLYLNWFGCNNWLDSYRKLMYNIWKSSDFAEISAT